MKNVLENIIFLQFLEIMKQEKVFIIQKGKIVKLLKNSRNLVMKILQKILKTCVLINLKRFFMDFYIIFHM